MTSRSRSDQRPNILLLFSDQHRYDCLGVNGHPLLKTPHLDGLAKEGVNFTQAYCPIPLCVPARTSLLNGQWPTQHLAIANYNGPAEAPRPAPDDRPTFSQCLRTQGYHLGYVGKWHVHPTRDPTAYGFHDYVPEEQYASWRKGQGLPPVPTRNIWFGETDPHITLQQSKLAWGADRTIELLTRAARQDQPFFVRWDPSEPHLPNCVPEPYASMYRPDQVTPWLGFADDLKGKPYIQAQQRRTWELESWTWEQWSLIVARYLGEISLMDAQIGRVLAAVEALGLRDQLLVVYTSDHGDMCGSHGMIDKHFIMYDDVVRVPMMVRWPGVVAPGKSCDAFVSNALDLASTFCDVAGVTPPSTFSGLSLTPLMGGASAWPREDIFATYHGNQFGLYTQRMVRDRRWKYVWNATAEDELYDLAADPGELRNRATDPGCAAELARLRRRLVAWMEQTGDPMLNMWLRPQLLKGLKV